MDNFGGSALLSVTLLFALVAWTQEEGRARSRWAARCMEAMVWLVFAALTVRVACVVMHNFSWSHHLRTWARVLEAVATAGAALALGVGVGGSRLLLSPRWSWLLAALIASASPTIAIIFMGGASEHISFWLRLCIYPLTFSSCWAIWGEEEEASSGAAHGVLLGIIVFLPTSLFLSYEQYYGDPELGDIKAAYMLALMAVGLNAALLMFPAVNRLWRGKGNRLPLINILVGLVLLAGAAVPDIVPPWEYEPRGWSNRMEINVPHAMAGALIIMITRATLLLRRWDPLGGALRGMCLVWLLLALGFLTSSVVRDWLWSYEVWVEKEQWENDVFIRAQVASGWVPFFFIGLMTMVPSVVRAVRVSWPSAKSTGS